VPDEFRPYLSTYDKRARDWGAAAVEPDKPWPTAPPVHYFQLQEEPDQPSGGASVTMKPYSGNLLVLVDSSISSATFNFSRTIQMEHLGTLIGTPTGGNKRGINGGSFFFLLLPHSGIEIDIPLIGTFPAQSQPDEGLMPDVLANFSQEDVAKGIDSVFNRALLLSVQEHSVGDRDRYGGTHDGSPKCHCNYRRWIDGWV
jgi:C-terminal processing protease CtpA/Prc